MGGEWQDGPRSPMDTGGAEMGTRPGGGRPPGRRGGGGTGPTKGGGGGGRGKGTRHTGGTSSSSVHDGVRILVVSMAAGVGAVVVGVGAFLAHGYGVI